MTDPTVPPESTRLPALAHAWSLAEGGILRGGPADPESAGISADNDLDAIAGWLSDFADRRNTHRAYDKECRRFYHWLCVYGPGELRRVKPEHVKVYKAYLSNPPPEVIEPKKRSEADAGVYYPFRGPLAANSIGIAFGTISSLFMHLVQGGYLTYSPFQISNVKIAKALPARVERYLSENLFAELLRTIELMPAETEYQQLMRARTDFMVKLAYGTMARVGDIARHDMSSFSRSTRNGAVQWWWHVRGKGDKDAKLPVGPDAIKALITYRRMRKLEDFPRPSEVGPLVENERGEAMTENGIYRSIVVLAEKTADRLQAEGKGLEADVVKRMTTHWLRHTGITHAVDRGASLTHVMKNARHSDLNTTRRYMHADADEQYLSITGVMDLRNLKKNKPEEAS